MVANGDEEKGANSYRWESAEPTVAFPDAWRKFLPTDLTSPHWYDDEALARLVFAHIAEAKKGGRDLPLRDFARQFRGLSGTAKAKQVCDDAARVFEREVHRLSDFEDRPGAVKHLLGIMKHHANPPSPAVLGVIGADHFRQRFEQYYGGIGRFWHKKSEGVIDDVPFVFEAALAEIDRDQQGDIFHGVNFPRRSATRSMACSLPVRSFPVTISEASCPTRTPTRIRARGDRRIGHMSPLPFI